MKLRLYMDFVCPWCYLGLNIMDPVLKEHPEAELEIYPYELNPRPGEEKMLNTNYIRILKEEVFPIAEKYKLEVNIPDIPAPHTDTAFFGLLFAEKKGKAWEYAREVCRNYWVHGRNIGDLAVLDEIAQKVGLEKLGFSEALKDPAVREEHRRRLEEAFDYKKVPLDYVPYVRGEKSRIQGRFSRDAFRSFLQEEVK